MAGLKRLVASSMGDMPKKGDRPRMIPPVDTPERREPRTPKRPKGRLRGKDFKGRVATMIGGGYGDG